MDREDTGFADPATLAAKGLSELDLNGGKPMLLKCAKNLKKKSAMQCI